MRQQDLARMLGAPGLVSDVSWPKEGVEVFDLFCGAGGFSQGAVQAGHRVVFACDFDARALATHERNHPHGCEHRCGALPLDDLPYPTDGRCFHLHGSPPCQKFSVAHGRAGGATEAEVEGGESLVEWFLREALERSNCTTWSMEEVDSPRIQCILEQFRRKHRKQIDWDVFDFELLGVPQTRTRILAGTPALIVRLRQLRSSARIRSVRDTIKEPRGTHVRGTTGSETLRKKTKREPGEAKFLYRAAPLDYQARRINKPAHTLCAKLRTSGWFTMTAQKMAHDYKPFNVSEMAALQTFPDDYKWPKQVTHAARQIGNAVPPLIAQLLLSGREQQQQQRQRRQSAPTAPTERCRDDSDLED
jgi:DNA (cytosine-5)-methyltransferase 1